ncbi:hypothetical protein [Streptomyces sp. NPDC056883]|uniref:hypothetical protein n=1 Tax=Streptomyces sp. NPDC056883 TaxID=3345959 RepID=UPI0036C36237
MSPVTATSPVRQVPLSWELRAGSHRSTDDKRCCYTPTCGWEVSNRAPAPRRAAA